MAPTKKITDLKKAHADLWNYPPAIKPLKVQYIACGKDPIYGHKSVYMPCWQSQGMSDNIRFGPCWKYSPERFKRFPLATRCRGATTDESLLRPNPDACKKHLYTRIDFRLEQCAHEQILHIECKLKRLERHLSKTKGHQIKLAKGMRYQAIRRRLLIGSACGIKMYPEYLSQMAEQRSICDFQKAYNEIHESNSRLVEEIMSIRNAILELQDRIGKLDRSLDSPFLKELKTVLQTIQNLYEYFFELARKLKTWSQLMDVGQEHSIDDYLALLQDNLDWETLRTGGIENCTCKRRRNLNLLEPYLPCWCQGRDRRDKSVKLVADNKDTLEVQDKSSDSYPTHKDSSIEQEE